VRSRMPVRWPLCAAFNIVPPQVCSTSSRCAAMARMSRPVVDMSVQVSLLQHNILAHDQPVRRHLFESWQHPVHMLVRVHENYDHRQLTASLNQMGGFHTVPSQEPCHGVDRGCGVDIFFAQVLENLQMQGVMMPLVGFV